MNLIILGILTIFAPFVLGNYNYMGQSQRPFQNWQNRNGNQNLHQNFGQNVPSTDSAVAPVEPAVSENTPFYYPNNQNQNQQNQNQNQRNVNQNRGNYRQRGNPSSGHRRGPKMPTMPYCRSYPGSRSWNNCWSTFYEQMARYQQQVFDYFQDQKFSWGGRFPAAVGVPTEYGSSSTGVNAYGGTSQSTKMQSAWSSTAHFSSSFGSQDSHIQSNGYDVKSKGIRISMSSSSDQGTKIFFRGRSKNMQVYREERKIHLKLGGVKEVVIKLPRGVKSKDMKISDEDDYICIYGPSSF